MLRNPAKSYSRLTIDQLLGFQIEAFETLYHSREMLGNFTDLPVHMFSQKRTSKRMLIGFYGRKLVSR